MDNSYIVKTIKQLCNEKQITIASLLEDCGLTKSFIYDLEKRKTSPSCEKVSRIADFFNCTVDYLLGRAENSTASQKNISQAFTQEEIDLIMAYRQAEQNDRSIVDLALHKYIQSEQGKTASAG